MGWKLEADDLLAAGVTRGASLERWNGEMLNRFGRPVEQDWAEGDPLRAAEAVAQALKIIRTVASTGGTPALVADAGLAWRLLDEIWGTAAIPFVDVSNVREGFLAGLPPSEDRLARLYEWPRLVGLNVDDCINATRIDLGRERKAPLRTSLPEPIEQPDVLIAVGSEVSSVLLAETQETGIPLIATVGPEADPAPFSWVIPGDFSNRHIQIDLLLAIRDFTSEGRDDLDGQLRRYGEVRFLSPWQLGGAEDLETWLQDRIASPQSSVDADVVIARDR
jgi:ribosomal protein S2